MTNAADRMPPSDLQAEQATLGAMLSARKACVTALGIVSADDFYREQHRDIFAAIEALHSDGEIVDPVTVAAALNRQEKLAFCGGRAYVERLLGEVVTLAHVREYATVIHNLGRLRRIIKACNEIMCEAYEHEGKPEELLREHLGRLQAIAGDCADDRTAQHTSAGIDALEERIKRQRTRGTDVSAARFGIPWVDRQLNGLEDWGMIVVRGDTKAGKSILTGNAGLATAVELARRETDNRVVLAYILEAREEWEERALAWLGHLDKRYLEGRRPMNDSEEGRYQNALRAWARLPLYVTDRLTHVDDIMLDIEQQAMQGRQPALIIVDHFQRVTGEGETATLRYDDAATKLAQVPRMHRCPILVPSQISMNNGIRQSMWARKLDQEATVVFDIDGERDSSERQLKPTLPRKFVPFDIARYYISSNFDARLWDEPTWHSMEGGR